MHASLYKIKKLNMNNKEKENLLKIACKYTIKLKTKVKITIMIMNILKNAITNSVRKY